jgi:hypothetical protein
MEISREVFNAALGRGFDRAIEEMEAMKQGGTSGTKVLDHEGDLSMDEAPPAIINPRRKSSAKSSATAVPKSPRKKPSIPTTASAPEVDPFPKHGKIISSRNPEFYKDAKGDTKKNPFYEPLPLPEVWHRRMPAVFPFGETPYMMQVVSDQINQDLSRSE